MKRGAALFLTLLAAGCGKARSPNAQGGQVQVTYKSQVKALLEKRCMACHGAGGAPSGGYDLQSYLGVLGVGSDDVPNAIAGQESSTFLTKLDATADAKHWGYLLPQASELAPGEDADKRRQADRELLRRWVVDDRLAYFDVSVHPPGWLYTLSRDSESFHGGYLRGKSWDMTECQTCHRADRKPGDGFGPSCETCHKDGPQGCTTCHGDSSRSGLIAAAPPVDLRQSVSRGSRGVGAHQAHLNGNAWWAGAACTDCHTVPTSLWDPGHVGDKETRATVIFGGVAAKGAVSAGYDRNSLTCSGIYCHGATLKDSTAARTADPRWTDTTSPGCRSCHGIPGKGLGGPECYLCHQQSVASCDPSLPDCLPTGKRSLDGKDVGIRFLSRAMHLDGKVPIGKDGNPARCDGCHGSGTSGAPPPGVHGEVLISAPAVGLHQIHLTGGGLGKAVACNECHLVPQQVADKGHIDHDLPARVTFGTQARGQAYASTVDTKPSYDQGSHSCQNTFCHGLSGAQNTSWTWNAPAAVDCTSCHGAPPTTLLRGGNHPDTAGAACKTCHASAYDSAGKLDPAKHVNGRVDL
jgi:predicted CxxxxCH...CXXCH cytochrome family protein